MNNKIIIKQKVDMIVDVYLIHQLKFDTLLITVPKIPELQLLEYRILSIKVSSKNLTNECYISDSVPIKIISATLKNYGYFNQFLHVSSRITLKVGDILPIDIEYTI